MSACWPCLSVRWAVCLQANSLWLLGFWGWQDVTSVQSWEVWGREVGGGGGLKLLNHTLHNYEGGETQPDLYFHTVCTLAYRNSLFLTSLLANWLNQALRKMEGFIVHSGLQDRSSLSCWDSLHACGLQDRSSLSCWDSLHSCISLKTQWRLAVLWQAPDTHHCL